MNFNSIKLLGVFIILSINVWNNYAADISYTYIFDYETSINVKDNNENVETILLYKGKMEMSPYILTDKKELLLLKLDIQNQLANDKIKTTAILIRQKGLVEKVITKKTIKMNDLNFIKGLSNILNIDDLRRNSIEDDVCGDCSVTYETINKHILRKNKTNCINAHIEGYSDKFDSFSIYNQSEIYTDYIYEEDGGLISIAAIENHHVEPVLFQNLLVDVQSSTNLTLNNFIQTPSLISNSSIDKVIRKELGEGHMETYFKTYSTFNWDSYIWDDKKFVDKAKKFISQSKDEKVKLKKVVDLVKLFRQATSEQILANVWKLYKSNHIRKMLNDVMVNCGTKYCSLNLIKIIKTNIATNEDYEAIRILMMLQNVRKPNDFIVQLLWDLIKNRNDKIYNQGVQTVSSLIEQSINELYLKEFIPIFVKDIRKKFNSCTDDICQLVQVSAMKNSKLEIFYDDIMQIIEGKGKYNDKVLAGAINSIYYLKYSPEQRKIVGDAFYNQVDSKIQNWTNSFVQYQCVNNLMLFQINTNKLVNILNKLSTNDSNFQYLIVEKLLNYIDLEIIENGDLVKASQFVLKSKFFQKIYPEHRGSKVLIKQLFENNNSLVDIHFNILGTNTGGVKHSLTDLYLVSTATENPLFSLNLHLSGMDSFTSSSSSSSSVEPEEEVEGYAQLSLFGRESSPVSLFQGTSGLMSILWSTPSELTSIFDGYFIPTDIQKKIFLQNGIVIPYNHMSALYLDFSLELISSIWYKTANSLIKATGKLHSTFDYNIFSSQPIKTSSVSMKSGIDLKTDIDFSGKITRNCFLLNMLPSNLTTRHHKQSLHHHTPGYCFSLSNKIDRECSTFQ